MAPQTLLTLLPSLRERFPTLMGADDDLLSPMTSIDDYIKGVVTAFQNTSPEFHSIESRADYLHAEELLADITYLIERCLVYRRETADLQIRQISFAVEYFTRARMADVDRRSAESDLPIQAAAERKSAYSAAHQLFEKGLQPEFAALYAGLADAADREIKLEAERRAATLEKLAAAAASDELLLERHKQDGGPLNFRQRIGSVLALLKGDLELCWLKSTVLERGLKNLLGKEIPLPRRDGPAIYTDSPDARFLDDWVLWVRKASEAVQARSGEESAAEVTISLGTKNRCLEFRSEFGPFTLPWLPGTKVFVPEIGAKLSTCAWLEFTLSSEGEHVRFSPLPRDVESIRLQGLSLSVSFADPAATANQRYRFNAWISNSLCTGRVLVSGIPPMPEMAPWVISPYLLNRDPLQGSWLVALQPKLHCQEAEASDLSIHPERWGLVDVCLHLKVAYRLRRIS